MSQEKYMRKVLQNFSMESAKPVTSTLPTNSNLFVRKCLKTKTGKVEMSKVSYASTVGSLVYPMVCTRPDIGYAVEVINQFMSNPGKEHWVVVKWILQYLKGTSSVCC